MDTRERTQDSTTKGNATERDRLILDRRCAIYARAPVAISDPQQSIAHQLERCRAFASSEGLSVVSEFSDVGARRREGLALLTASAAAGVFGVVVVPSLDRLARSLREATGVERLLHMVGVSTRAVGDGGARATRSVRDESRFIGGAQAIAFASFYGREASMRFRVEHPTEYEGLRRRALASQPGDDGNYSAFVCDPTALSMPVPPPDDRNLSTLALVCADTTVADLTRQFWTSFREAVVFGVSPAEENGQRI